MEGGCDERDGATRRIIKQLQAENAGLKSQLDLMLKIQEQCLIAVNRVAGVPVVGAVVDVVSVKAPGKDLDKYDIDADSSEFSKLNDLVIKFMNSLIQNRNE